MPLLVFSTGFLKQSFKIVIWMLNKDKALERQLDLLANLGIFGGVLFIAWAVVIQIFVNT